MPEFVTIDPGFDYSVDIATSVQYIAPIQIYKYIDRMIIDATQEYPTQIILDAQNWIDYYLSENDYESYFYSGRS